MPSGHSTRDDNSSLPFGPAPIAGGTMPSADFCRAVREDCSPLSPEPGHPADLLRYAVIPSVPRRRMYTVRPSCRWRTLWLRAHSSRAYHTSYPVRVPRPALSFHPSFGPHLMVTPLRFPCPSAPRTPGQGTFTPKHDSMHGTPKLTCCRKPERRRSGGCRQSGAAPCSAVNYSGFEIGLACISSRCTPIDVNSGYLRALRSWNECRSLRT